MISFVWSSKYPFMAGSGGSESYTAGHVRELMRRGIECRILTIGNQNDNAHKDYPDIIFESLKTKEELSELDDTIIFITYPLNVKTKHPSYVILHCPPPAFGHSDPLYDPRGTRGKKLIATSRFAAGMWSRYNLKMRGMKVVYPFAEPVFSQIDRPASKTKKTRILFAGRLIHDKGIYTLLAALHLDPMLKLDYRLTVTSAGAHTEDGKILEPMLKAHPLIKLVPAGKNPRQMARLMAAHDIVVMPSTDIFWKESFGILSIEAQHAGCRVVASKAGGLPETNCGGLITVKPDNPLALANGIVKAATMGPLTVAERRKANTMFTLEKSVNSLLRVIKYSQPKIKQPHKEAGRLQNLYPKLSLNSVRLKQ